MKCEIYQVERKKNNEKWIEPKGPEVNQVEQHTYYGNLRGRNERQRGRKNPGRNNVQKLPKSNARHEFTNQEP